MLKAFRMRRSRAARADEGTIAVMAAVIIPVVLLVIALALASLVWGTSETEAQRASDQAALQAAASTLLVPSVGASVAPVFPTLSSVLPSQLSAAPLGSGVTSCKTLGNVYSSVQPLLNQVTSLLSTLLGLPRASTLTSALTSLDPSVAAALQNPSTAPCSPITVLPSSTSPTRAEACDAASSAMSEARAPWSHNFYSESSGTAVPDCDTNQRVRVALSDDENNLLDLGGTDVSLLGSGATSVTSLYDSVQTQLTALGVRLQTALPNSLCPEVSVSVDQPVKGPLFGKVSVPNGRSTARRVIKNAVIVPVFNGVSALSPTSPVLGAVTTPPVNLNTTVLAPLQANLLNVLDAVNAAINSKLAGANLSVSGVAGASVGQLDLLSCLRNTVADLYNPPVSNGSAPTSQQVMQQVLSSAAANGEAVNIIQVGVQNCPGAVSALDVYKGCIAPALPGVVGAATGLYDVPFLDVTPAIVSPVAGDSLNFQAVPVAATQAGGAFRSVLVRGADDDRFLP